MTSSERPHIFLISPEYVLGTYYIFKESKVQYLLGLSDALEVAYYTYIYAKVEKTYYQEVTSFTVGAILAGRFVSGLLTQLLVSTEWMNFAQLHYITFASLLLCTFWSFFLPAVGKSPYFHQESETKQCCLTKTCNAFLLMKKHIFQCFRNTYVLKWITWLSLSTGCFILVITYVQLLWGEVVKGQKHKNTYNGAAEAIFTLVCFLSALLAGKFKKSLAYKVELILTIGSLVMGFVTLIASQASSIVTCYACYIIYGGFQYFLLTIGTAEIMKHIEEDSYGLILGVVSFITLIVESTLSAVIVTKGIAFELPPRQQNLVCGLFHICVAAIYIIIGLANWIKTAEHVYSRAF